MLSKKYLCVALISLTILSTELFWTRLFSAEFFYTFAFLVLSLAVLGLGLGALCFKMCPSSNKASLLPLWLSLTGLMILLAVPLVFALQLDFTKLVSQPIAIVKLIAAILLLGAGFFFGGMSIAMIFKTHSQDIPRLYMSDLIGASFGVLFFFIIMNTFGAVVALIGCALPVLLAAIMMGRRWSRVFPVVILILGASYYILRGSLPEQKREERAPVVYKHWDATAKIKVFEFDSTSRGINIDNVANSPVYRFDGNWNKPDSLKFQFNIDVGYLIKKFTQCRFLSLGAGGGTDVLQALQYNSAEVHAVEVVTHINHLLQKGFLREYSGGIYHDPRVKVVTGDARAYVRQFEGKFDVIYSLSSNSWAAFASGAFALAENYLFTTEAFIDYWQALSENGYMSIEHQFYAPRLVVELMDALQQLKVPNPNSHFAVYNLPTLRRKILLISKSPLTVETIQNAYGKLTPKNADFIHLLYPRSPENKDNIYDSIVNSGWKTVADTAKIDISPCTDNRPFIAQLGLMRNIDPDKLQTTPLYEFSGFPLSRIIILIILAVCVVLIVPLNLLPYLKKGEKLAFAPWLYFFAIGVAYMMIEVILIQKYTLFIGSSVYSIALILSVLLVANSFGSRHSNRYQPWIIFTFIGLWLVADIFVFRYSFYLFEKWPLLLRLLWPSLLIAPLGYFMGTPFPMAASRLPGLVDWAFAVNGSASVIGSVLAMLIAFSFGYSVALSAALGVYLLAFLLFTKIT